MPAARVAMRRAPANAAIVAPVPAQPPIDLDVGFDRLYGLEVTEAAEGLMRARVPVRDALKQPAGLVHGGVYAAIADSLATNGTLLTVAGEGQTAFCMANHTSFLRPITAGMINAVARARHRGRTTWVWEVEVTDDNRRLCVLTRVTVAVRPVGTVSVGGRR
jgi:uncharacterized protein (TIGR00369 family)